MSRYYTRSQARSAAANTGSNQNVGLSTRIRHTIGVFALAITTLFLEFYLRFLSHIQPSSRRQPVDDVVDANANYTRRRADPVTWISWVKSVLSTENGLHICRFCQRLITLQSVLIIGLHLWPTDLSKRLLFICSLSVFPRLLFSILIVMKQRNYRQLSEQPTNPDRHVNLTLMLLHYTYKGIRHVFKVLSGIEQIVIYICQTIEFVFVQLLGYTYKHPVIRFYAELESFIALILVYYLKVSYFECLDIFISHSKSTCLLPAEIVLMIALYVTRFLLRSRAQFRSR